MKTVIALISLIVVVFAQRPSYAGSSPKGRPGLGSRFKDQNATTEVGVNNRVGEDGSTMKIPVDARGDSDLVNRLNQWPREHRPFWLLNSEHIEASRNGQPSNLNTQNVQNSRNNNNNRNGRRRQFQESRNNFNGNDEEVVPDYDSDGDFQNPVQSIPIRPNQPRSSFLGPLRT